MQKNPGFRGLKNLKKICWVNGTTQCVSSLEFLSSYYSNNGHLDELINISEPKTSIFNLFSSLQIALKKSQPVPADSLLLAKHFCEKHLDFKFGKLNDAFTFFINFIDEITGELQLKSLPSQKICLKEKSKGKYDPE